MKRLITALAALAMTATLLTAPVVLLASPAEAANRTPGCIKKAEFRRVKRGMTLARTRKIVGARGRVTYFTEFSDGDAWKDVAFRQCGKSWSGSSVSFSFEKTEKEVWIEDWYCDDYGCEDWGYWDTKYTRPFRVTSKYAYWG